MEPPLSHYYILEEAHQCLNSTFHLFSLRAESRRSTLGGPAWAGRGQGQAARAERAGRYCRMPRVQVKACGWWQHGQAPRWLRRGHPSLAVAQKTSGPSTDGTERGRCGRKEDGGRRCERSKLGAVAPPGRGAWVGVARAGVRRMEA